MAGISKGMVGLAALVAFGLVIGENVATGWSQSTASATQTQSVASDREVLRDAMLRARAVDTLRALLARRQAVREAHRPANMPQCREQSWPYYSGECLVASDGRVAPVARVIPIDRPAGELLQMAQLQ